MITLALPRLYDAVVAAFVSELAPVNLHFGWREPTKSYSGARIIFVPGDPTGRMGEVVAPKYPGLRELGRHLMNTTESFHIFVVGYDVSAATNERAQYQATRELYDDLLRHMYDAAHGTFAIKSVDWVIGKKEFRAGAALRLTGTIQSVQDDREVSKAPADTKAHVTLTMLDESELLIAP